MFLLVDVNRTLRVHVLNLIEKTIKAECRNNFCKAFFNRLKKWHKNRKKKGICGRNRQLALEYEFRINISLYVTFTSNENV